MTIEWAISIPLLVVEIGIFYWFLVHYKPKPAQKKHANMPGEDRLCDFFGTRRSRGYRPTDVRKEAREVLDFLKNFKGSGARLLQQFAFDALKSGTLPDIVKDEHDPRMLAIGAIWRQIDERQ